MKSDSMLCDVTVVIPVYNAEKTIIRALDSVADQTLLPRKIILIDDRSSDNSHQVISDYIANNQMGIECQLLRMDHNSGPAEARNVGIDAAVTEYIAFLDSDDAWHPQKIEVQYGLMLANKDVIISGHPALQVTSSEFQDICRTRVPAGRVSARSIAFRNILFRNYFSTPTVMLRKTELRFIAGRRFSEDYLFWLQNIFEKDAVMIDFPLAYIFKPPYGDSGLSSNIFSMQKGEFYNYFYLFKNRNIGFFVFSVVVFLSAIKFIKRLAVLFCGRAVEMLKSR